MTDGSVEATKREIRARFTDRRPLWALNTVVALLEATALASFDPSSSAAPIPFTLLVAVPLVMIGLVGMYWRMGPARWRVLADPPRFYGLVWWIAFGPPAGAVERRPSGWLAWAGSCLAVLLAFAALLAVLARLD